MAIYMKGFHLLGEPTRIPVTREPAAYPEGYRMLVGDFGVGEFNGEVGVVLPGEVQPYSVQVGGLEDTRFDRLMVFANCGDGASLAWDASSDGSVVWIPPRCTSADEVTRLSRPTDWVSLMAEPLVAPDGLVEPYFVPRGLFEGSLVRLGLAGTARPLDAHVEACDRWSREGWSLLRRAVSSQQVLTQLGMECRGIVILRTTSADLVSGALDSQLVVRANPSEVDHMMERAISLLQECGWLFEET